MEFMIKRMNEEMATQILQWRYQEPYDFYNNEVTSEGLQELIETPYTALTNKDDELVGFYCTGKAAQVPSGACFGVYNEDLLDIGLGMKPDITGKGQGYEFMSFILNQLEPITSFRLTVAAFNSRAIHLYEKLDFVKESEFQNGGVRFITMVKRGKGTNGNEQGE